MATKKKNTAPKLSAKLRKSAKTTLVKAKKLLNGGANWVQNKESEKTDQGVNYCMIGALREANGPGEAMATHLLAHVIDSKRYVLIPDIDPWDSPDKSDARIWADILDNVDPEDTIIDYNDTRLRKYSAIELKFDKAIALVDTL